VTDNWQSQRTLTPLQFKRIVKKLGITQAAAGRYVGLSLRTVRRITKGKAQTPPSAVLLLRSLVAHGEQPLVPKWTRE
jgi:DNA-binding transcriptional regulator YiaG